MFHPLVTTLPVPKRMNNPFCYTPHPLCVQAIHELEPAITALVPRGEGKMFGILIVVEEREGDRRLGCLAAYSGQIAGRADWPGFVPAVFDYLQPGGHFKTCEAEITVMNHDIRRLESLPEYAAAREEYASLEREAREAVGKKAADVRLARHLRDRRRLEGPLSAAEVDDMTRESQFLNAELHRAKKQWAEWLDVARQRVEGFSQEIERLKQRRHEQSDALQRWLFQQFQMLNATGQRRSLLDLFADTPQGFPPSGAGECAEPKLLQYAFSHGLKPLQMNMFWWGASPRDEVRHHRHFYPACSGKCKPILKWMLGLSDDEVAAGDRERLDAAHAVSIVYEDAWLLVVNKPAGMLSVTGKTEADSVEAWAQRHCPEADVPMVVHRLDMDTSGLMLLTKHRDVHRQLQVQFERHAIRKRYVVLLSRPLTGHAPEGVVSLPLSADVLDRPRQKVDSRHGKRAVTRYRLLSDTRVELFPETGRTHQLRVHCAHPDGLADPIRGDRLYGQRADRLYLHAAAITFRHPVTGQTLTFTCEPTF